MDKRKLNVFSLGQVDENVMNEKSGGIVITNGSAIVQAIDVESNPYISRGQTYIFYESRMGIVTSGTAELEVNLTSHHLSLGDIITMPAESIVTIKDFSNDYKLSVLLFPENTPVFDVIHISAENDAQGDITDLYNRLWSICTHTPDRKTVIIHLQQAIHPDTRFRLRIKPGGTELNERILVVRRIGMVLIIFLMPEHIQSKIVMRNEILAVKGKGIAPIRIIPAIDFERQLMTAVKKDVAPDRFRIDRKHKLLYIEAVFKASVPQPADTGRNFQLRHCAAGTECSRTDLLQRGRQMQSFHPIAGGKGVAANDLHRFRQGNIPQEQTV